MRWSIPLLVVFCIACSRTPDTGESYANAWTAFRQGRLQAAQTMVDAVLARESGTVIAREADPLHLLQVEILLAQGQAPQANRLLSLLSDPKDPALHLRWMADRADALWKTRHAAQAVALLDEVDRTAGDSVSDPAFKSLLLRGAILANSGNYDAAEQLLSRTAERANQAGDSYNQTGALLNLSFTKLQRDQFDQAAEYSLLTLEAAKQAGANRMVALANNNLGNAYSVLGDFEQAEKYEQIAIGQLREIGDLRNLANALGTLGNIKLRDGHSDQAKSSYEEAVKIAASIDNVADAGRWAGQMAQALIKQGDWNAAETWNRKASKFFESGKLTPEQPYLDLNEAAIAQGRGNADEAFRLYREVISKSGDNAYLAWNASVQLASALAGSQHLPEADAEFARGLAVIEHVRSGLLSPDARMRYQELKMDFFRKFVELRVVEGQSAPALQVAEYSRARVLAENLGIQPRAIGEVRTEAVQKYARRTGSVLLSYWLAPERSFVWVITPQSTRMEVLPGESEIAALVATYRTAIETDLRDPVAAGLVQGQRLRHILLDPVQKELANARRVVVIPDGALHGLNFETLPSADKSRFWIEDVELSVAPSLSVLSDAPVPQRVARSLLLIGAPNPPSSSYAPLPAAEDEIRAIESRFQPQHRVVHTGSEATPRSFLDASPERYSTIHFAAHAEANELKPLESAVILSGERTGYKLYARDIAGLKLSAELVTISACRSAGARSYGGEGLVGFVWAFLQSGAHSVIAGLWDVGDRSSAQLMTELYAGISAGKVPAAALRQAKLTMLHSGGPQSLPFSWAPFQIYVR